MRSEKSPGVVEGTHFVNYCLEVISVKVNYCGLVRIDYLPFET